MRPPIRVPTRSIIYNEIIDNYFQDNIHIYIHTRLDSHQTDIFNAITIVMLHLDWFGIATKSDCICIYIYMLRELCIYIYYLGVIFKRPNNKQLNRHGCSRSGRAELIRMCHKKYTKGIYGCNERIYMHIHIN